jgi:hypothetical protein
MVMLNREGPLKEALDALKNTEAPREKRDIIL